MRLACYSAYRARHRPLSRNPSPGRARVQAGITAVATTAPPRRQMHALPCHRLAHAPLAITPVVVIVWPAATRQKPRSLRAVAARLVITPAAPIVCAIDADCLRRSGGLLTLRCSALTQRGSSIYPIDAPAVAALDWRPRGSPNGRVTDHLEFVWPGARLNCPSPSSFRQ